MRFFSLIGILSLLGCNESVNPFSEDAGEGGLLTPSSTAINYVVGNTGPYNVQLLLAQNESANIESIEVYKSFSGTKIFTASDDSDSVVSYSSNEMLDRTISVSSSDFEFLDFTYTFDELKDGLTVNGDALPTLDGDYNIGDSWSLKVVSILSDGRSVAQRTPINLTVSTRYAGRYLVTNQEYYRIGDFRDDVAWPTEFVIESIDATTYRQVEYFGAFDGNELYFQVIDGVISYPENKPNGDAQIGNDQPLTTCNRNPADLSNVNCATSNVVIDDDVNGEDLLIMTYGYFTAGSGAREFYQELKKIVE